MYVETVDVGESTPRTVVARHAQFFKMEQLRDRPCLLVSNGEAVPIVGVVSQGVIVDVQTLDKHAKELVSPPSGSKVGDTILPSGTSVSSVSAADLLAAIDADAPVPSTKVRDIIKYLKTNGDRQLVWKDLTFAGCVAQSIAFGSLT